MKDIAGKLVLVTGGAMGMGKQAALYFARAGARIILVDLNEKELKKAAAEIQAAGAEAWSFVLNVADRAGVYRLAKSIAGKIGVVDILVNNAGIVVCGTLLETNDERIRLHYEVNVLALIWFMKAFLPGMIKKGAGHIVNIASSAGMTGVPYMAPYVSTKWAVIGLTESVRMELAEEGITGVKCTSVCPGFVTTGMFEGFNPPTFMPARSPEFMGRKIFEAVVREKVFVREPFIVKTIPLLRSLFPVAVSDWMSGLLGATRCAYTWKGHGLPPGIDKGARSKG